MAMPSLPAESVEDGDEPIFADINITPLTDVFPVLLVVSPRCGSHIPE
jgi:hypothetical protein